MGVKVHFGQSHEGSISGYSTECSQCGQSLRVKQKDRLEGNNFCDNECESVFRSNQSGEDTGNWKGGKVTTSCENCDESVERWPGVISQKERIFCSSKCQGDWRSENFNGEDNPNFRGGVFEHEYGPDWTEKREEALDRADEICEHPECSKTETKPGMGLDVHHIVPRRYWDDVSESNNLDNLIVLCRPHHRELEPPIYNEATRGKSRRRNRSPA